MPGLAGPDRPGRRGAIVPAGFDRLVAEFERFQSALKRVGGQVADFGRLREEIGDLEVRASTADRSVTVVVGPGGTVTDIELTTEAMRRQPGALSASIMATLRQAVDEAARRQARLIEQHMGDDMNNSVLDQVLQAQAQATGTSVEDLRSKVDQPRPGRPAPDDKDLSQGSVFESGEQVPAPEQPPSRATQGERYLRNLFDHDEEDDR